MNRSRLRPARSVWTAASLAPLSACGWKSADESAQSKRFAPPRHHHCLASFLFLASLFCAMNFSNAAETNDFFAQGVAACRTGQLPEAAAAFETAAQQRLAAGTLDNLGIVEWQRGHAGAAILAWERARWIDPFDPRAGQNLAFARQVTQLDGPHLKWFETLAARLPANAWLWTTAAGLWLAVGALTLPGVLRRRRSGWHQMLASLGFCLFLFSLTADIGAVSRAQIGFVLKKDAPLLLTPTRAGEVVSTLTAGEPARKLRARGDYFLIRTGFATGWIERDQFGLVCPQGH